MRFLLLLLACAQLHAAATTTPASASALPTSPPPAPKFSDFPISRFPDFQPRFYLSGHDRADAVPWEFFCSAGARSGVWSKLPVPSNWEAHGFGTPTYHKDTPQPVQGRYRHRFTPPASWSGGRVFLVFDGSMTDTTAFLNGKACGPVHRGGFYRFRHEVTELLRPGTENLLEVTVDAHSADDSVNRAERTGDYWNFSGIFRPVWLESVPPRYIERLAIDARADGSFNADVFVDDPGEDTTLTAQIFTSDNRPIGTPFSAKIVKGKARLQTKIDAPALWSAESPALHRVVVSLRPGTAELHQVSERFGFRTFEVREGDGLYLNGSRIILQGANRHSFHPDSGRCLSEADHLLDIRLMKEMNMNAVRMSHYPPDARFLELCDELGLYVLDELAGWQKSYSTEAGRPLLAEMVKRDVNHPSILFWDNGNEGGWNTELDADYALWDPQGRKVLHPWNPINGVNTSHYSIHADTVFMANGDYPEKGIRDKLPTPPHKPFIFMPTEFLHALYDGGAAAGLEDYWNAIRAGSHPGGGFIWALVDEGFRDPATGRINVRGNAAPDGILGPYREKEASFNAIKELWSPVVVSDKNLPFDFNGSLALENRFSFNNTSACRFTWTLSRMPAPGTLPARSEVIATGLATAPAIAPGAKGRIQLPLPAGWRKAHVLSLRIDDPQGRELWTSTWPLPGLERLTELPSSTRPVAPVSSSAVLSPERLIVVSGGLRLEFSRATGNLVAVSRGAKAFSLSNGPRPSVGNAELVSLERRSEAFGVRVTARYKGSLKSASWLIRPNGWVDCEWELSPEAAAPAIGVSFDYPEDKVRAKRWVGGGPARVWQNRLAGAPLGYWENDYNDTITGWRGFAYPEFKGCFAGVRWLTLETTEGSFTAIPGSDRLYVQVLTPSFPPADLQKNLLVQLPSAGLSLLHTLPAIGNKFHAANLLGPSSLLPPLRESYQGKVSFLFP